MSSDVYNWNSVVSGFLTPKLQIEICRTLRKGSCRRNRLYVHVILAADIKCGFYVPLLVVLGCSVGKREVEGERVKNILFLNTRIMKRSTIGWLNMESEFVHEIEDYNLQITTAV